MSTVLLVFDMLSVITVGFYWRYVSKDWLWLQVFAVSLNAISITGLFVLTESPEYLYSYYRFNELRQVLSKIAKWNSSQKGLDELKDSQIQVMGPTAFPEKYVFDTELDLKVIKFSKNVAVKQEAYV